RLRPSEWRALGRGGRLSVSRSRLAASSPGEPASVGPALIGPTPRIVAVEPSIAPSAARSPYPYRDRPRIAARRRTRIGYVASSARNAAAVGSSVHVPTATARSAAAVERFRSRATAATAAVRIRSRSSRREAYPLGDPAVIRAIRSSRSAPGTVAGARRSGSPGSEIRRSRPRRLVRVPDPLHDGEGADQGDDDGGGVERGRDSAVYDRDEPDPDRRDADDREGAHYRSPPEVARSLW
ncbi:hypothetical protein FK85_32190, partial [Halorubrum saccharovorum]